MKNVDEILSETKELDCFEIMKVEKDDNKLHVFSLNSSVKRKTVSIGYHTMDLATNKENGDYMFIEFSPDFLELLIKRLTHLKDIRFKTKLTDHID